MLALMHNVCVKKKRRLSVIWMLVMGVKRQDFALCLARQPCPLPEEYYILKNIHTYRNAILFSSLFFFPDALCAILPEQVDLISLFLNCICICTEVSHFNPQKKNNKMKYPN